MNHHDLLSKPTQNSLYWIFAYNMKQQRWTGKNPQLNANKTVRGFDGSFYLGKGFSDSFVMGRKPGLA